MVKLLHQTFSSWVKMTDKAEKSAQKAFENEREQGLLVRMREPVLLLD